MRISDWSSDVCSSDLDLRGFDGYRSARSETASGAIWLNANEAAYANVADDAGGLRRYPSPQPDALRCALADLYDCAPERLLIGRGSDERSEEHTSELQSLMRISYAVFCLEKKTTRNTRPP